jgi:hypothetical protein
MLSSDTDLLARARQLLAAQMGSVDIQSAVWPFESTDYYEPEMGADLKRQFVSFEDLIHPERIGEIKRATNELETRICDDLLLPPDQRAVNLDPGYVALSKLVLATTKDHAHRIYLQRGIYAEVTLRFEDGAWRPWPWTYPDYAAPDYHGFFVEVRDRLREQLQALD